MRNNILQKLKTIDDLATLPVVVNNLIQITNNPKASARDVAKAISQDPSLTAHVLRIANSALYGFPQKIVTVNHAIVILGFANIRNIVLAASIYEMFPVCDTRSRFDREAFWQHSLACGITSNLLARKLGIKNIEEAFIWGLLHDIGKIVLDAYFHDHYCEVFEHAAQNELSPADAENAVLEVDHAEIGGIIAKNWNLPPTIIKVIRFHHSPSQAHESMRFAAIIHIADILCRALALANGSDDTLPLIEEASWNLFRLDRRFITSLYAEIEAETSKAASFFSYSS